MAFVSKSTVWVTLRDIANASKNCGELLYNKKQFQNYSTE